MDFKEISSLIDAVSKSKLTFFEVECGDTRIKMEKKDESSTQNNFNKNTEKNIEPINCVQEQIEPINEIVKTKAEDLSTVKDIDTCTEIVEVVSPIVGAVYLSPGPDSNNFVKLGSKVKKDDTLCIIEAMKLMNEIQCEVNGEIIEILVENEQMLEYGQAIFKIKKEG